MYSFFLIHQYEFWFFFLPFIPVKRVQFPTDGGALNLQSGGLWICIKPLHHHPKPVLESPQKIKSPHQSAASNHFSLQTPFDARVPSSTRSSFCCFSTVTGFGSVCLGTSRPLMAEEQQQEQHLHHLHPALRF